MSYDIDIVHRKNKKVVTLKSTHGIHGGTYALGGTTEATFNITYNYAKWFYELWPKKGNQSVDKNETTPFGQMFASTDGGIRSLYGKPLKTVIKKLSDGIQKLHGEPDEDYWKPTEGNARDALFNLKLLCEMALYENPKADLTIIGD